MPEATSHSKIKRGGRDTPGQDSVPCQDAWQMGCWELLYWESLLKGLSHTIPGPGLLGEDVRVCSKSKARIQRPCALARREICFRIVLRACHWLTYVGSHLSSFRPRPFSSLLIPVSIPVHRPSPPGARGLGASRAGGTGAPREGPRKSCYTTRVKGGKSGSCSLLRGFPGAAR